MDVALKTTSKTWEPKIKKEINYVVDNSRNSVGTLAAWCNWTRRRRIDPFATRGRCRGSGNQFTVRAASSLAIGKASL